MFNISRHTKSEKGMTSLFTNTGLKQQQKPESNEICLEISAIKPNLTIKIKWAFDIYVKVTGNLILLKKKLNNFTLRNLLKLYNIREVQRTQFDVNRCELHWN